MQPSVYYPAGWPGIYPSPPEQPQEFPATDYAAGIVQVESSVGPSRVLTRRQRAALEHAPQPRRTPGHPYDGGIQRHPSVYISPPVSSRPHTPPLALNMPPTPAQTPVYHPLTPSSASSPYSTYGFYHSRGNSLSNSTNPRSASPALSTASALTSVSSSTSAPASFALSAPPPAPTETERVKQKKHRLYNVDRKAICIYHKENPNARQEDIARLYGVERSTISKILKNKTKWLNVPANEDLRIAKHRPSKFPEIEEDMVKWLLQCRDNDTILSDSMIRNKAKAIAHDLGIVEERFKASSGWIENFKHRHGVRAGIWVGDGKNVRAARALGLGPRPDDETPLLSPLNTGFSHRNEDLPELSPEPEDTGTRPGEVSLRPSWLLQPADPPQPPPPPSHPSVPPSRQLPDPSRSSYAATPFTVPYSPSAPDGASAYPTPRSGPYSPVADGTYPSASHGPPQQPAVVYEAPPRPPPEETTLAQAEAAINTVIHFLDTRGHGILQAHERNVLTTVKCALFQAASGIAYDRTVIPYEQGQPSGARAYEQQGEASA
ncbi:Tc5 transposase DNA-binding domain-containing protein [Mycena crocata]|nr:Tc5 transposase DNA-binding domain-containing protein [Mycena crocata]